MNLLRTLKGLFRSSGRLPFIPNPPPPPDRAPKTEPSCFAKGIAESIRTEPEMWRSDPYRACGPNFSISHNTTDLRISGHLIRASFSSPIRLVYLTVGFIDVSLSDTDLDFIASEIEAHPIGQLKSFLDQQTTVRDRQAAALAHFTTLGCPDTPIRYESDQRVTPCFSSPTKDHS